MNYKTMFWFGTFFIIISLWGMLIAHEYSLSGVVFLLGMAIVGFAYGNLTKSDKIPINTERVNKNIQTLNDILWGKEKKENTIKISPEQYWQISVRDRCRDTRDTRTGCYCYYGGCRGYCTFEQCPRRNT
jgi:hypothetical protein